MASPTQPSFRRRSARARLALAAGATAAWASRTAGRGAGATLPGLVGLRVDPGLLSTLAAGRTIAVVSATNGKTTTARMLAAAVGTSGPVLSNTQGSNLERGVLTSLMTDRRGATARCVFEVDELALAAVARQVRPRVFVLGNLSRDQLDRMIEVRVVAGRWRAVLAEARDQAARDGAPAPVVVANADDPMVASAVLGDDNAPVLPVVWVGVAQPWTADAASCPRCARPWSFDADYRCEHCGFSRPTADWRLDGTDLVGAAGLRRPLELTLPGRANRANAVMAVAAAAQLGVDVDAALAAIRPLGDVAGRYAVAQVDGVQLRLLLAKNPAGWQEMLDQAAEEAGSATPRPVVLALNAQGADGKDTSWIWDVPFEKLRGRPVLVAGERAEDLAVRLRYAEISFSLNPDPIAAVTELAGQTGAGHIDLLANYTAFTGALHRLGVS